jgi:formate-dependent phosphoribosylglycinamide formyltransferase (GAR transformylase)
MNMRFIPTSVHGAVDHVVGPALVLAPTVLRLGRTSPEGIVARAVGGAEAAYSNITDYELSVRNVVPMPVHLALDAVGGATLALVPQLTGARRRGKKHWVPHLAIGAMEIGMALMTKTEPPKSKTGRSAKLGKLLASAKGVKGAAEQAVRAIV